VLQSLEEAACMEAGFGARSGPDRPQVGTFVLDHERGELSIGGRRTPLRPKTFTLLAYLADRAGRAVSKQELLDALWPGLVVTEDSLTQAVSELRSAIGDRDQKLIRTLPRRGYLFDLDAAGATAAAAPDGAPADGAPAVVPAARRPGHRLPAAFASAVVVAAVLALVAWQNRGVAPDIGVELAERRSVAVMPFTDLSEPKAPHVAFAVDHALTTDLGRLGGIKVIARESSAALGTSDAVDPQRAGRELAVRHLLTGSVRLEGPRLAIFVRLLRTDTGALLWSDRFDYPSMADWTTQADMLARVANELHGAVNKAVLEQAVRSPLNREAVDHWMRGRYLLAMLTKHEQALEARRHFEAALAAQPQSVHALTGLAFTHLNEVIHRWSQDPRQSIATAKALARQALDMDANDPSALKALGGAQMFAGEVDDSMSTARRLLELNPNDAHSNRDLAASLYFMGRWDEALRQLEVAGRLNPLDASHMSKIHGMGTLALIALHRYDEAVERARQAAATSPSAIGPLLLAASAEAHRGNLTAARLHVSEVLKRQPGFHVGKAYGARASTAPAYLEGIRHADAGLRLAGLPDAPASAVAGR
jgi:DNA-binding winged helix-turn-helix (wHTH) protein/TolB-like protein